MTSERTLLRRAKALDSAALSELYDRYAPKMYAYICRRVSDPVLAEDLTGELFLRMLRAIHNERSWHSSFSAWLYRMAHNLVVDHYRQRKSNPDLLLDESLVSDGGNPAVEAEETLSSEQLRLAIRHLTPEQQEVLALRFGEGLTARRAGEIMNKTTGAVEALQRRGLAALRRILTGQHDER